MLNPLTNLLMICLSVFDHFMNLARKGLSTIIILNLHINEKFPPLGASPDGLLYCDCHGHGILERKCLHKYKDGFAKRERVKN